MYGYVYVYIQELTRLGKGNHPLLELLSDTPIIPNISYNNYEKNLNNPNNPDSPDNPSNPDNPDNPNGDLLKLKRVNELFDYENSELLTLLDPEQDFPCMLNASYQGYQGYQG